MKVQAGYAWLDEAALLGIENAVGASTVFDREHLRDALLEALARFQWRQRQDQAVIKRRVAGAQAVTRHIEKLLVLLHDNELYPDLMIEDPDAPAIDTLLVGLRALNVAARRAVVAHRLPALATALDWWVNDGLGKVYEKHFNKTPGRSRTTDGLVDGPYVRFVRKVSEGLGVRVTDETVARYWKKPSR